MTHTIVASVFLLGQTTYARVTHSDNFLNSDVPGKMFFLDGEMLHMSLDNSSSANHSEALDRQKRYLLYLPMSLLQFTFLYAMPIELMPKRNLIQVLGGQIAYEMPFRLNQLTVQDVARSRPDVPQPHVLRSAEIMLEQKGMPGRACVLLAVCQMAETPLEREVGLLEEIVHLLLTPSEGSHPKDWENQEEERQYLEAERIGREGSMDCRSAYPQCNLSLLDVFTKIMFT